MKKEIEKEQAEAAKRLPYEPPKVVSEEVFETLALTCGKASTDDFRCLGSISS